MGLKDFRSSINQLESGNSTMIKKVAKKFKGNVVKVNQTLAEGKTLLQKYDETTSIKSKQVIFSALKEIALIIE